MLFRSLIQNCIVVFLTATIVFGSATAESGDVNRQATATAQIMAGIVPVAGDPVFDRLVGSAAFLEHHKWMADRWALMRNRISAIELWRARELKIPGASNRTLLYPFSGPDFINAYAFFPNHPLYIFFSLERPGRLPDLESVTADQFGDLLRDVRHAFRDIFERNYFITDYMSKQLATPWLRGSVPIIATMMVLMQFRIVGIEPIDLYPELTARYQAMESRRPRKLLRGVRIAYSDSSGGPLRQLYYFSLDATDKALEFYPRFLDWVAGHRPTSVLLKSASYLLHDGQFEKTRALILQHADYVIQDDTGIPYRLLNQSPWQVRLYGHYTKPIKGLRYGYQADLESAYRAKPHRSELPFPFGYHWRGKQSGLLIATR